MFNTRNGPGATLPEGGMHDVDDDDDDDDDEDEDDDDDCLYNSQLNVLYYPASIISHVTSKLSTEKVLMMTR